MANTSKWTRSCWMGGAGIAPTRFDASAGSDTRRSHLFGSALGVRQVGMDREKHQTPKAGMLLEFGGRGREKPPTRYDASACCRVLLVS